MIYQIKTPATSANVGIGFDTLGIALSLYNTFHFEVYHEDLCVGFKKRYENMSYNLVYKAYKAFYNAYGNAEYKHVKMTLLKENIPISRGLGSSASLILAGVFASNALHALNIPFETCVAFAATYEGHPDNVYACAYGGLISVIKEKNMYYHQSLEVSSKLNFHVFYPFKKGSTKMLRKVLPKHVSLHDAIHNVSRMSMLPKAFKDGEINVLKILLNDKLHEPYRIPVLQNEKVIQKLRDIGVVTLSGSGPTLLFISNHDALQLKDALTSYEHKHVHVSEGMKEEWI